jgi:hypothetical protein
MVYPQNQIPVYTLGSGGGELSNSGYSLTSTIGEVFADNSVNTFHQKFTGFWYLFKQVDDIPPVINAISEPIVLWPANHTYENIELNQLFVSISDNWTELSIDDVYISLVTSDEEEDAQGGGDGNTLDDMVISQDCKSVQLRKERLGGSNGRVYTVTLASEDENGNIGTTTCKVTVPHTNKTVPAIEDGILYTENCVCEGLSKKIEKDISILNTPQAYELSQNFPNPFNPTTTIQFGLPEACDVTLYIYNVVGQLVRTLKNDFLDKGYYQVLWDAKDDNGFKVSSGIYFYRLTAGSFTQVNKMILMK